MKMLSFIDNYLTPPLSLSLSLSLSLPLNSHTGYRSSEAENLSSLRLLLEI
jgi:hypothetical protein